MTQKPNILFILSDQHSPHIIGCGGNSLISTPNLDNLAKEGVYFDNAYCQNPLCVPSRSSLLTGQYSKNLGIYDNMHVMEANTTTIPRTLSHDGYRTCLIGKAHFNGEQYHGYQQRPYGDIYGQAHQPDPSRLPEYGINGLGDVLVNSGSSQIPIALTQTEICVSESIKWLQTHVALNCEQPFFLSINFDKPHFPIKCPEKYFNNYKGRIKLPETTEKSITGFVPFVREGIVHNETGHHYGKDFDIQEKALTAYYGCVEWIDDAIGRILESLEYLGLSENTVVIYSSDHGEMGGEHGTWQKTLFFEASSRVPLIIRWPGHMSADRTCSDIIGLVDLFPSICEITGNAIPDTCDGISIVPLFNKKNSFERDEIFSESSVLRATEHAGCMLRTGQWKYCFYLDGNEELYNLKEDPTESDNLCASGADKEFLLSLRNKVKNFWEPDKYIKRLNRTPIMSKEKHFYVYSNQFSIGNGIVVDARP